jgi:hypothetical protein
MGVWEIKVGSINSVYPVTPSKARVFLQLPWDRVAGLSVAQEHHQASEGTEPMGTSPLMDISDTFLQEP